MKIRSSLAKAKWTDTREEDYQRECEEILFKKKSKVIIDNEDVYVVIDNQKDFLLKIKKQKSKWFEIWLKLKEQ